MNRKALAGIFGLLLTFSAVMGLFSILNYPSPDSFGPDGLHTPGQFTSQDLEPLPDITGNFTHSPNISVIISMGNIYVDYGSSVRIQVINNDIMDIFLEEVAFEWTASGARFNILVHRYINSNQSYDIRALGISGPSIAGSMNYQLSMKVLIHRNTAWYRSISRGGEWLEFSDHTVNISETAGAHDYIVEHNDRRYYQRVNELVDPDSDNVAHAAENATAGLGTGYNIGKVCAIFDYLDTNCIYTEDPGRDEWYSPDQLLDSMHGDCEDYAMLISAMVTEIGGTSRVYLTNDHAFAAVYVGNTSAEFDAASNDICRYYGTDVKTHP